MGLSPGFNGVLVSASKWQMCYHHWEILDVIRKVKKHSGRVRNKTVQRTWTTCGYSTFTLINFIFKVGMQKVFEFCLRYTVSTILNSSFEPSGGMKTVYMNILVLNTLICCGVSLTLCTWHMYSIHRKLGCFTECVRAKIMNILKIMRGTRRRYGILLRSFL